VKAGIRLVLTGGPLDGGVAGTGFLVRIEGMM
jgi:hypothetical protein